MLFLLGAVSGLLACGEDSSDAYQFLAIGHVYRWDDTNDRMDPRIDALDLSDYDGIWLLGDLTGRTSEQTSTLDYIDAKFDLDAASTHWSIGNHDLVKGDSNRIVAKTGRPTFYYAPVVAPGLNLLVLNTNLFTYPRSQVGAERCAQLERQLGLVESVTELQTPDDHLVVLHHHALLTNERADTFPPFNLVWNFYHPEFWVSCDTMETFSNTYLPHFDRTRARGTEITFVGGDIGQRTKRFEHRDEAGMLWLGTGINNSMDPRYPPDYVTSFAPDHLLKITYRDAQLWHQFIPLGDD